MRLYLTLYSVYRVGTSNVPRSFETTAWSGSYPAGFDIGTSGGIGIRASSVTADKRCLPASLHPCIPASLHPCTPRRNHGKLLMDQKQVNEWCAEGSKTHYVQVDPGHYAAVPREVRGVPHATIPGVHAYLDDYANAMERARGLLGIEDRRTVDSLQCLTLGPFAERQPPHVSEQSGTSVQPKPARNSRVDTASCVRRPDRAASLPQPRRRRAQRGARLPGGRDVRGRGHHARAARAVRRHHLAPGLHLWPVAALPHLGDRRRRGARPRSRAART